MLPTFQSLSARIYAKLPEGNHAVEKYNRVYLDLLSDINFCLVNTTKMPEGGVDRKSDCGRNSVSTNGSIELLYVLAR